jgi:hypothetical protein
MGSLKNIISALQREIAAALEENKAVPACATLQPGKVTLSLDVRFHETKTGGVEITCHQGRGHNGTSESSRVTIEFEIASPSPSPKASPSHSLPVSKSPTPKAPPSARIEPSEAANVKQSLSSIFGAPGFDSSARAAVFRDAVADLSAEQAQMLIQSFSGTPLPDEERAAKRARMLILKLLKTGPMKSAEEGAELLTELFARHDLGALLNLIGRDWNTRENWAR